MSFSVDVSDWIDKATEAPEAIVRGTAIKLFSEIIFSSPVDEGTFRSNWNATVKTPSTQVNEDLIRTDDSIIGSMSKVVESSKSYSSFILTNNLPYARRLEFGYSDQAPQGMVRVNAIRFNELIKEEARKL